MTKEEFLHKIEKYKAADPTHYITSEHVDNVYREYVLSNSIANIGYVVIWKESCGGKRFDKGGYVESVRFRRPRLTDNLPEILYDVDIFKKNGERYVNGKREIVCERQIIFVFKDFLSFKERR